MSQTKKKFDTSLQKIKDLMHYVWTGVWWCERPYKYQQVEQTEHEGEGDGVRRKRALNPKLLLACGLMLLVFFWLEFLFS